MTKYRMQVWGLRHLAEKAYTRAMAKPTSNAGITGIEKVLVEVHNNALEQAALKVQPFEPAVAAAIRALKLPEPEPEFEIDPHDIIPVSGQHPSGDYVVRLMHLPTGTWTDAFQEKSMLKAKAAALKQLRQMLEAKAGKRAGWEVSDVKEVWGR